MADWGLVTTVRTGAEKVRAFVAHHLSLGATRLWLYFDDPGDQAFEAVAGIAGVTAIRCDAGHWSRLKGRPERHQNRQAKNAGAAYRTCPLPWIGHVDGDEFLWPAQPVHEILDLRPRDQAMVRMEPFEAMHDPTLPDDIYTARLFRGPLRTRHAHLRDLALGPFATVLPAGHLSHANGKCFFRAGTPGLSPRLHGAFLHGERLAGPPFEGRLPLLHFHAQDREAWLAALPFRLSRGAYQYHPALQAHLQTAGADAVEAFYQRTQRVSPETAALLRAEGRLIEASLDLRRKVAALG